MRGTRVLTTLVAGLAMVALAQTQAAAAPSSAAAAPSSGAAPGSAAPGSVAAGPSAAAAPTGVPLQSRVARSATGGTAAAVPSSVTNGLVLGPGVVNPAVTKLQRALRTNKAANYFTRENSEFTTTFDLLTKTGLLRWERANLGTTGVVADARVVVGSAEWQLLITQQSDYVPPPPPQVHPAPCYQNAYIICASISGRSLYYFEYGTLVATIPARFGRPGYDTPKGVYTVRIKDPNAWSYPFSVYLPWSLEYDLVRGIYIHWSAAWNAAGDGYVGSHGCINIKDWELSKWLFYRAPLGTTVYVY